MFEWIKRRGLIKKSRSILKRRVKEKDKYVDEIKKQVGKCGNGLEVFGNVDISYPERVSIGKNCKLNHQVYLNARSEITIGDDVSISYGAKLISTGYDLEHWIETGERRHFENKPIHIGNHCWIGAGAIILPGVHITGEYVVIGAGAVVTKSIAESKVVLAGSPAKIVKRLGE